MNPTYVNPNYVQQFDPNNPADAAYLKRRSLMGTATNKYNPTSLLGGPDPSNLPTDWSWINNPSNGRTLQSPPQTGGTAQMAPQADFSTQLMDLLKRYQQLGTKPFVEQGLNAQDAQVTRGQQTPDDLIGASPSTQSGVRNAAMNALDPIVSSAKNSAQTYNEQLTSAKDFLKEIQSQREKETDNARAVVNNILTTTDPESIKNLNQDEVAALEKAAGYPKGFLASAITYKQKTLDNAKTVSYQDLGDQLGVFDNQGNLLKTVPKGTKPGDAPKKIVSINGTDYQVNDDGTYSVPEVPGGTKGGNELKDNARNSATQLLNLLNAGTGTSAVGGDLINRLGPVGDWLSKGTGRANFLTTLDNLKSLLSLDNVKYLKGQGQVSDAERRLLEAASSKLSRNLSEGEFKSVLSDIIKGLSGSGASTSTTNAGEIKMINGTPYKKVPGGWIPTETSFNSAGNASASNRPTRNNNPLNIKVSTATSSYPGVVGADPSPAADGGKFLIFNSPEAGFQAAERLITSANYRNLSVDAALRRWSNNGYGGEIAPALKGKVIAQLSPTELQALIKTMARREGYTT